MALVDFDDALNNCIRRLRQALNDDAEAPRFIETLPRRGYRFMADVQVVPEVEEAADAKPKPPIAQPPKRRRLALLTAAVTLLIISVSAWLAQRQARSAAPIFHSIAVLPLENLSGDPSQEYFADGMTEALITDLAKLNSLRVISRTSVRQYKGGHKSIPQIARELGVDAVIEGSVARSGQTVRITAQLLYAAGERHLWAESYERNFRDILRLQDQVALAIAEQVRGRLSLQEQGRLAVAGTVDPEAYDSYIKGRYFWSKFTLDGVDKSLVYFHQAIAKDPSYASAHAGLAESYINLIAAYNVIPPVEGCQKARGEPKTALEIDDTLADAHTALARFRMQCDWDWAGAEREFQRAIGLEPGSSEAHHQYAHYLMAMGRGGEAWAESRHAMELDPLGVRANSHQGWHHFQAREYDQAIRDFQRTLTMEPTDSYSRRYLANAYQQKAMYSEALAELLKTPPGPASTPVMRAALGYAYAVAGNRPEAMKILHNLQKDAKQE